MRAVNYPTDDHMLVPTRLPIYVLFLFVVVYKTKQNELTKRQCRNQEKHSLLCNKMLKNTADPKLTQKQYQL